MDQSQTVYSESQIGDEGFAEKSLQDLVEKVVHGFVVSLQEDSADIWQSFNEVLEIIQPYSALIEENAQLTHYVGRTYNHFCENANCGLDVNALSLAFPREMQRMKQKDQAVYSRKVKFPSGSPEPSEIRLPVNKMEKRKRISVPKGTVVPSSDIYDGHIEKSSRVFPDKKLHIDDLRKSLPFVVYEIGLREASWGRPLGMTAVALNIDLAEILLKPTSPQDSESYLNEGSTLPSSLKSSLDNKIVQQEKAERRRLTGREVVEKFVVGNFLGATRFAYLNMAPSKRYDPYNLVVVPRNKKEPEHFVVSSHAILHVIPNGPSELQPLAEWYKEALLFSAILKFNFFKNYLLAKMFLKWKHVKKMSQFRALRQYVGKAMVSSTPSFGSALIRISSLIQDLDQVQFLPLNDLSCKRLQKFNGVTVKLLNDAHECLKMFFSYCLSVINKTSEHCFEYLDYCKEQLQRKSQKPKGSLSLAKERKAIKEQNVKLAHHEIYQFEKFVKLVEQILLTKLLTLARHNICTFVNGVLGCEEIKHKGLFSVLLQFDKMDKLVLVPSRRILQGSLFFSVESVLKILCQSSDFLDEEFCESERHMEDTPYASSERTDSKQTVGASPNRLQSFLISQSPFSGAASSSLPAVSVIGRHELNEAGESEVDSPTNDTTSEVVGHDKKTEKLKSLLAESLQQTNELPQQAEEDHPETPKACVSLTGGLLVKGKEIQPHRGLTSPLSKTKLEATVLRDEEILAAMSKEEKLVNSALEEVDVFCREHEWIVEISNFVRTWNKSILASWRGRPPGEIEKQLSEIKTWIGKFSNIEKTFVTANGLLFVNCSSIHDDIIPKLNAIFRQLTKMVAKDLLRMSSEFSIDVTQLAEKLSNRNLDFKAFAEFTLVQKATRKRVPSLQVKVEYIKSLFDMIRFGYRQLTGTEEEAEERTWDSWEKFLLCLQESSDFILVETSQVLRDVEETIMTLEHQVRVIGEKAVSGEFLIPENNPTMILSQLRKLRERFWSLLRQLDELIECREVICGRKYNKSYHLAILNKMDVRYELWKYYDVSAHTINDWLQMPFRKMNVKKVTEKITEWQVAAQNMKSSLSDGDEVYESWIKRMESFMKDFPLLQQLSMDALKQRHWKALFVSMGQQYDANWQFTIADLFSFKLGLYKDLINSVCNGALHEYAIELQLRSLAKVWTDKDLKLAKHFARTKSSLDSEIDSLPEKGPSRQGMRSRQNHSKVNDVYILTGDDELKYLIEDNRVTLQLMLVSPYVADLKPTVEAWMKNLEQLEEILDLWVACQKKWLYLSLVFTENSGSYQKTGADRFEEVDTRFKEFMQSVIKDSKVLSILAKKRGEKNYRELQGEALRSMLFSLLKQQEELLKSVEQNMEKVREAFPRLYFLSDSEVLDAMVISRDPRKLVPVVRKCFSGIKSVRFGFPENSTTKLNTALDEALNAHLLQVTAIEGDFGEVVVLADPIAPCIDSQTWLNVLEKSMKTALMMNLTECFVNWFSRRKHMVTAVSDVFDKGEVSTSNTDSECRRLEPPWLLKYPSQCLRSVEAATWYNDISHALSSKDKTKLKTMSSSTNCRVEDYAKVLSGKEYKWLTKILRSRPTLESLLVCAIHQRDVVKRLLSCNEVCLHCFEWQSCLHHHISLEKVFSTTYCSGLPGTSRRDSSQDQIPLDGKYKIEEYNIRLLGSEFPYGFEYLSEPVSLVVTPLTERCFLTLTMSLKNYSCGTPFGSSGTGKTETIKELAKIMGRHIVFFNCSYSMANAVATRLLTGMILSGSWVCFEVAHNLPQTMLSTLGEYLGCIKESYKCLAINKSNKYFATVTGKADGLKDAQKESIHLRRRNSFTALDHFTVPETACENPTDAPFSSTTKKSTSVSRRYSIACGRNIDKTQFYDNEQPLLISIPLTPEASLTDCALFSPKDKDVEVSYQQPNYSLLGNIVFNGMLLKAHPMAGSFLTIIPTTNGYMNIPENLKVSLRTVAMMVPDMKRIIEVWLLCNGFSDVGVLAQKISFFIKVVREEFPSELGIETSSLRTAIYAAGNKLRLDQSISETTEDDATVPEEELEFKPNKDYIEGISSATSFLQEFENRTNQESAVVFGLFSVLCPKLDENDKKTVCDIIDTVFTHTMLTSSTETNIDRVAEAVRQQLNAETLQSNMDLVSKVIQLYQVLQTNHAVIIMGSSGTGKTTIYQTLCRAINSLNTQVARDSSVAEGGHERPATSNVEQKFPKVNLSVLFPRAMNENELFGWIDPITKLWVDGILVKRARNAQAVKTASDSLSARMKRERELSTSSDPGNFSESDFHQWVVLDGPLDRGCVDQMNALFDGSRKLSLASGEMVPLSETMSFLLELDDLKDAAPSVVSHCGIVYCSDNTVGWKSIFKSWLKGAHTKWNISIRGLGIVSSLMEHCVEKTLTFLSSQGPSILYANYHDNQRWKMAARGVHEIQRFLAILSSLFDKHILRDNDETLDILDNLKDQRYSASCSSSETASGRSSSIPASDTNTVISSFAYAFIWAFGGDLHESSIEAFDDFVKSLLSTGPYPHSSFPPVSVFDYHLDFAVGCLLSSTEKISSGTRTIASSYVVVPRAEVYFSLLDLLVSASKPVLLVGPPGSGKTSFMQNIINPRYKYTRISLAHGMTTQLLQETIEAKVQHTQRRQSVINNPALLAQASRTLFFLDDLNLAATDGTTSNIQPSTEVIRSLLSLGGLYDRERLCLKPLSQTSIVGAAVPPGCPGTGGGVTSFPISPRLARIMVVLSFHPVSGATLRSIYRNLFQTWLEDFPAYSLTHHHQLAKAISTSTVCLFETISQELRPTPVNPHYIFTHHDVARVLQGMMLFSSRTKNRSRPKIRHKKQVVTTTMENTEEVSVLNDQSLSYHDIGSKVDEKENNLHQDKSWPMVTRKETLVSMNCKTPAVLAPMIRVLLRLWCHECSRVFSDRLTGEDKLWFSSTLHKTAIQQFCETSLDVDDKDNIAIGVGGIIPTYNSLTSFQLLGEDVDDDDFKTLKDEESIGGESFAVDYVETEEDLTTAEGDNSNNEKPNDQINQEHSELDDPCGDHFLPQEVPKGGGGKPAVDSRTTSDNSGDEIQFKSQEPSMPRTAPSKQRVVTFEDMSNEHVYRGPLISPDQLMEQDEDLSKILFCRHFVSTAQETGSDHDRGYNEYSVAALADGLNRCQQLYNSQEAQPLDLVFFEQAVRHVARLSRCLSLFSGHAIFLSQSGHGRKSLVLLACFAANCKLIKLKSNRHEDSRQRIKGAMYLAGLQGKPAVLYVPEDIDHETMLDVSSLMSEGNCPGLFSLSELSAICGELIPGGQRGRRNENLAIAQERFFRRVRTNLRVALSLEHPSNRTHTLDVFKFSLYPFLSTRASGIDVYQPWHHNILTKVSSMRLEDIDMDSELQDIVDTHLTSVTSVMSFIHRSTLEAIAKQFGFNRYKCYSPGTFVEFVNMFGKCCNRIWREEQGKIERYKQALKKVEEANDQINEMQKDLDSFVPILRNAEQEVKNCLELVESLQSEYTKGRGKCKEQEGEIEKMIAPIEELERLAKIELDRVSPVFKSAYDALRALNVYDVEEIRSYRTPPDLVVLVVNAVCLLFGKEESWEEGKVLFSREDFIKDLEFFNMKAISDKTFRRLKEYVENPKFDPDVVKEGSLAAMSVCVWIRAVYHFCVVYRDYFPKQQRVIEAKKILEEAVAYLGDLRVRNNEIKAEVEAKIEEYKEKVHHARSIEKQIQVTEQRKTRAVSLIQSMSVHVQSWEEAFQGCQYHIKTLAGDALLTAACVCYLGPMDQETREKLLGDWKISCQGSTKDDEESEEDDTEDDVDNDLENYFQSRSSDTKIFTSVTCPCVKQVPVRSDFSLKGVLTTEEELYNWRHSGLPSNTATVENALQMRSICELASRHWPLLIDTDQQSYMWVKCLHRSTGVKEQEYLDSPEMVLPLENPSNYEDVSLPVSPCLTNADQDSTEDQSTNYEESDSPTLHSNQSSRRESGAAGSGVLFREELARELNIQTSPQDYTSTDSTSTDVDFADERIMIISAADRQRDAKLCGAISVGATVILVDVERKTLGTRLDNLLTRNTFTDKNGKRKIRIGTRCIDYHPSFRLYLYTNMPLELTTSAISLPFKKCLVINMALSCEGLQELLLSDVLSLERPEYEAQRRSLEADIYHHEQQIKNAENSILDKVITLQERLLENGAISGALSECGDLCDMARQQLEESKALYELAKEKQEDYCHVSEHGAALLTIVSKLSKLHSYYQMPFNTSLRLFHDVILQRRRGTRSTGSSLARSAELITYITRSICSRVARSVFSDHYDVFTFLVAVEKLRLAGQISEDEWEQFYCFTPESSAEKRKADTSADDSVPSWISPEIWTQLIELDVLPGYHGLKESIQSNSGLWKEYFELPPTLMAPTPSNFHQLSVFQRTLLWKTFKKDKLQNVTKDLVLYQLGTNASVVTSFSIDDAYQYTSCITPVIIFIPEAQYIGNWRKRNLKDPVNEIVALAKRHKMNDKLRFLDLGGKLLANEATSVLRNACEHGLWLVIQNCHLIAEWLPQLLDIFHQITLSGSKEQIMSKHGIFELDTNTYTVTSCVLSQSLVMHPKFRLWLITAPETATPIPAVLIRYGIKLAWDDKITFDTSVRQSFLTVWNQTKRSNKLLEELQIKDLQAEPLLPYLHSLALFHSILHRRCLYESSSFNIPYHWHYSDLSWGLEAVRLLKSSVLCSCLATTCQSSALRQTISILYGGQVLDLLDWTSIVALSERHLTAPNLTTQSTDGIGEQSTNILFNRLPLSIDLNDIGLNERFSTKKDIDVSNELATNISKAFGIFPKSSLCLKPIFYFQEILDAFDEMKSVVYLEQNTDQVGKDESSFITFLDFERRRYLTLLNTITSQLQGIIKGLRGDVSFTSDTRDLAILLCDEKIPRSWFRRSKSCPPLAVYIASLKNHVQAVLEYSQRPSNMPLTINIAAFLKKQTLFYVLLADWSKASGRPIHMLDISIEVCRRSSTQKLTAADGIYLTGLVLCNASWNESEGCIEERKEEQSVMPCLLLRPRERNERQVDCDNEGGRFYLHNCPVYFYDDLACRSIPNASFSHVPLRSRLPCHICQERKVFLTCSM